MRNLFILFCLMLAACTMKDVNQSKITEQVSGNWITDCTEGVTPTISRMLISPETSEKGSLIITKMTYQYPDCSGGSFTDIQHFQYELSVNDQAGVLKIENLKKSENQISDAHYNLTVDSKNLVLDPIKVNIYKGGKYMPLSDPASQIYHKVNGN